MGDTVLTCWVPFVFQADALSLRLLIIKHHQLYSFPVWIRSRWANLRVVGLSTPANFSVLKFLVTVGRERMKVILFWNCLIYSYQLLESVHSISCPPVPPCWLSAQDSSICHVLHSVTTNLYGLIRIILFAVRYEKLTTKLFRILIMSKPTCKEVCL